MEASSLGLLALAVIVLLNLVGFFFLWRRMRPPEQTEDKSFGLLLSQMNELTRTVDQKLIENTRQMTESLYKTSESSERIVRDITERLTRLDETNKQVVSFTDQLQSLQDMLKNPKQRGILGEYYLETLLKNVLPPESFQMQYAFRDGLIVDAAVFVRDKIIPVDSKFSLENYNRMAEERNDAERARLEKLFLNDLKLRIQETAQYIRPAENTLDFAFMFIPHEAIYYDLLVNKVGAVEDSAENLIQRAASKYRVIIVSPTSFLAYLQTVLQGLKALHIEESAKVIRKNVEELGKHLKSYEEYHGKLGNALGTVVNHYNATGREFRKIDKDVMRITGEGMEFTPEALEAPDRGE